MAFELCLISLSVDRSIGLSSGMIHGVSKINRSHHGNAATTNRQSPTSSVATPTHYPKPAPPIGQHPFRSLQATHLPTGVLP